MEKYSYLPFINEHNGIWSAMRVVHYSTLQKAREAARKYCKEKQIPYEDCEIARYHIWRGMEDKTYKI